MSDAVSVSNEVHSFWSDRSRCSVLDENLYGRNGTVMDHRIRSFALIDKSLVLFSPIFYMGCVIANEIPRYPRGNTQEMKSEIQTCKNGENMVALPALNHMRIHTPNTQNQSIPTPNVHI